jgi:RNA polymerase sigma-70 factor (ECF subfamily)
MLKSESKLIKDLKNQDRKERAFSHLLTKYQERLYWYIRKIVISHDNSNDVLQETFVRIYRNIGKFEGKSSLLTWMYRIAHNESLRFIEKNKNSQLHHSVNDSTSDYLKELADDAYFDGNEMKQKFHEVLLTLTEKQKQVFQMKYFDELSFKEISDILNTNENTLKSSYYSAVKTIEENILK